MGQHLTIRRRPPGVGTMQRLLPSPAMREAKLLWARDPLRLRQGCVAARGAERERGEGLMLALPRGQGEVEPSGIRDRDHRDQQGRSDGQNHRHDRCKRTARRTRAVHARRARLPRTSQRRPLCRAAHRAVGLGDQRRRGHRTSGAGAAGVSDSRPRQPAPVRQVAAAVLWHEHRARRAIRILGLDEGFPCRRPRIESYCRAVV